MFHLYCQPHYYATGITPAPVSWFHNIGMDSWTHTVELYTVMTQDVRRTFKETQT